MSNIDLIICYIKNWLEDKMAYITAIFIVIVIAICIYGQANIDINKALEKENRINNIEITLQTQMNYIHELEADLDNLYRVVEEW